MQQEIYNKAINYIDSKQEDMRRILVEMAMLESPSSHKEGVDSVCAYIEKICKNIGMDTKIHHYENAGNSFTAKLNATCDAKEIALMGHMDTVHPVGCFGTPAVRIDGDYIYGPGVYDCKGGLVIAILTCMALKACGYKERPIQLLFSGDEEIGHKYSHGEEIFLENVEQMAAAINCESGLMDGRIVTGRKSGFCMKMMIEGVAAHSGNAPQNGRSAIKEAAYKILEVEKHTDFQNTTYNCGIISGGTVANKIPDYCELTFDIRVRSKEAGEEAIAVMQAIADKAFVEGTKTTLIFPQRIFPPMEADEKNMKLFHLYEKASVKVGALKPVSFFSGGGSDSVLTSNAGVPTICAAGIRGEDNHALTERAYLPSIAERAKILTTLILDFPNNF